MISFRRWPFSGLVEHVVATAPLEVKWPLFAVMIALYVWMASAVVAWLWCWLDYQLATTMRRARKAPLALQYSIGDVIEATQRWTRRFAVLLVLTTLVWAGVAYGVNPAEGSILHWFRVNWEQFLLALLQ